MRCAAVRAAVPAVLGAAALALAACAPPQRPSDGAAPEWIRVSDDHTSFVEAGSGRRFVAWGFNYDHDHSGRLLEDYWREEWPAIEQDFQEMRALGANVVRIHLQLGKFLPAPDAPDAAQLQQLGRLLELAERTGLYLDLTGLACYHLQDVPPWYAALDERGRWAAQARFWEAVASTCAASPMVFCYDLMNEPVLPGEGQVETDWLPGELAGNHYVQRVTLDLAGRTRAQVAKAWIEAMVAAVRRHDARHMITVGVIPWALVFPGARPDFTGLESGALLDFASVHFYPKRGEVEQALAALAVYEVGKPLLVEETFPLECSVAELDTFIERGAAYTDGWIGFYWGQTPEQLAAEHDIPAAMMRGWLEYFREQAPRRRRP